MNLRCHALLNSITALLLLILLSGCALYNQSYPAASIRVPAATPAEITDAARTAFTTAGYGATGQNADSITFVRRSTPMDEFLYGNWDESVSHERVVLLFHRINSTHYQLDLIPYSIRGEDSSQDVSRRLGTFHREYRRLLKVIQSSLSHSPSLPPPHPPGAD
jgi:hypothetical protein